MYDYKRALEKIHEDHGKNTTFYISTHKNTVFDGTLSALIVWIFDEVKIKWTRRVKEDGKLSNQCSYNRLRSLGDIYKIVQHYRPGTTLQEVRETILCSNFYTHYCGVIKKRIFLVYPQEYATPRSNYSNSDEFNLETSSGEVAEIRAKKKRTELSDSTNKKN